MNYYIMEVADFAEPVEEYHQYLIEAEDYAMVKYWYHASLKDRGYSQQLGVGENDLLHNDDGHAMELIDATELTSEEWAVMEKYISKWYKPRSLPVA
jgi:hypothetical protein